MNLKKLAFWTTLFTTAAVPLATAQNPVILQGNYVSNVFGQSNFVLNPNAQTNLSNTSATAGVSLSRSTTTPLVATSEYNISTSSFGAGVYAEWTTRTFDAGMKNQNCEARFSYRGFAVATTTAQIVQGSNTVAQLVLTPSTDPRIASINFPCGDLSNATVFRIQQGTANLTGTNEIGGIYLGLATNQANVAQAETVVIAARSTTQSIPASSATTVLWNTEPLDVLNEYDPATGLFTAKRAGYYNYDSAVLFDIATWGSGDYGNIQAVKNSTTVEISGEYYPNRSYFMNLRISGTVYLNVGDTFKIQLFNSSAAAKPIVANDAWNFLSIKRFPTSSELVVKPETQNTWGGVVYTTGNQTVRSGQVASGTYQEFNKTDWNQPTMLKGKAAVTTTNSGNDLGFSIPNLPVGNYKLTIHGLLNASNQASTVADAAVACSFRIYETTTSSEIARQTQRDQSLTTSLSDQTRDYTNAFFGVFNNTSVGTRNFRLEAAKTGDTTTGGTLGLCEVYAATTAERTNIAFLIEPLDQPSNSALYVQGPVQASATGATIAAGYQGENILVNPSGNITPGASIQDCNKTVASYTLQPGVYLVFATLVVNKAPISGYLGAYACISTSPNANDTASKNNVVFQPAGSSASIPYINVGPRYLNITTATTIYLTAGIEYTTLSTGTYASSSSLQIVRLN
jgi:hypothetical protein